MVRIAPWRKGRVGGKGDNKIGEAEMRGMRRLAVCRCDRRKMNAEKGDGERKEKLS